MATLVLFLLLLFSPRISNAQAEVEIGIRSTFATRIPLHLAHFVTRDSDLEELSWLLEKVVLMDLEFSGLFSVSRGNPKSAGDGGVEIIVRGILGNDGRGGYFEGRVIDASEGHLIGGKKYRIKEGLVRRIAHHFSDEVIRLLTGEGGIASTKMLFVKRSGPNWELLMSDYDGYNVRALLRLNQPILNPRWVERGRAFVYTSYILGKADLFIRYLDEPSSKPIATYPGLNYSVDWSDKRGEMLATLSKDGNPEIYILSVEGAVKQRLTHNRAIDCSPSWSPGGREVLFTSDRSGNPQLYIMEADGSNVRRLTFHGNYNASPAWSPRGDLIAFVSRIEGHFQLCTIKPDGSNLRILTDDPVSLEDPRWAGDGRHIVCSEKRKTGNVISIVDIATGGRRILSQGENPDWSLP